MRRIAGPALVVLAVAALITFAQAAPQSDPVVQTLPSRAPGFVDIGSELEERAELHAWLASEMVEAGLASPMQVDVTYDDLLQLDEPTAGPAPYRVGLVRPMNEMVSLAGVTPGQLRKGTIELANGAIRGTADGGFVFTTAVSAPGATALRLHFTDFWLPEGAELYLYTLRGEVFGPYNLSGLHGDGAFWSHTLNGDQTLVQIRHHGPVSTRDLADTWFFVEEVGYLGEKYLTGITSNSTQRAFCQYNASCIENVNCGGTSAAVNTARDAIAHMQWVSGAFLNICTGGLIADSAGSGTPYFLTANHCISKGKDARNLETFFQLTMSGCGSTTCDDLFDTRANHPQSLRTVGASIKATGTTGDYTLLQLNQAAPAGSAFLGWTTTPVAFSNGTPLHRVSHPQGAPQAYSSQDVDTSAGTCFNTDRGDWIYSRDTVGGTEGGSSGSPVVNGSGQVVGQLTGSCGTNTGDSCDSVNNATIDGAFAAYFSNVEEFLDPAGCTPSPEVCTNGSDDDCDSDVDCDDADCSSDPACQGGGCGGNGASCSSNGDCCSNKCRRGSCKGN